jgi:hypothetical protein
MSRPAGYALVAIGCLLTVPQLFVAWPDQRVVAAGVTEPRPCAENGGPDGHD